MAYLFIICTTHNRMCTDKRLYPIITIMDLKDIPKNKGDECNIIWTFKHITIAYKLRCLNFRSYTRTIIILVYCYYSCLLFGRFMIQIFVGRMTNLAFINFKTKANTLKWTTADSLHNLPNLQFTTLPFFNDHYHNISKAIIT